jgi:dTDP-glucose 4,6-dehydratase|tara:strand:+ start:14094 stop:15002 length:909 start_codon:yes stop_codon:yes gene_type:complete
MQSKIFVVTGGRGFIGSHFVELLLKENHTVIDIDKMTYAANSELSFDKNPNYTLIKQDIKDITHLPYCHYVVNFAAESHVDNSIVNSFPFIESNIIGVHNLLDLIRRKVKRDRPVFFQISTDEVYGDILEGSFSEPDKLKPSNPYSAAKAAAEMLVMSYGRTYDIDYFISRSTNNYGPRQYFEKLIPRIIHSIKTNTKVPLHGDGSYVRDWIHVQDNVDAIYKIITDGSINEIYNISSNCLMTNLEVVNHIKERLNICEDIVEFVPNRTGQDLRYSISNDKVKALGWSPKYLEMNVNQIICD